MNRWPGWAKLSMVACVLLLVLAPSGAVRAAGATPAQFIRLHVVGNSDSAHDQALKVEVRDAIIPHVRRVLSVADSTWVARRILCSELDAVKSLSEAVLSDAGTDQRATVRLTVQRFPEVDYGKMILPEGQYWTLQVVLGSGGGENWWCVLFPSLCFVGLDEPLETSHQLSSGQVTMKSALWQFAARVKLQSTHFRLSLNPAGHFYALNLLRLLQ